MDDHLRWESLKRKKIADCRIFDVYEAESRAGKKQATFIQIDAPDWVTVVPTITDEQGRLCFVMVRQYRHGSMSVTVEFPAGTVERGEDPTKAALRELLEETGYRPKTMVELGNLSPNPAFLTNSVTYYVAEGLESVADQQLDEHEMIDIELIPVDRIIQEMGGGVYSNAIMMTALCFYLRYKGRIMINP